MAQYDWICDRCGEVRTWAMSVRTYGRIFAPPEHCYGPMRRLYSPVAFTVQGGTGAARKDRK